MRVIRRVRWKSALAGGARKPLRCGFFEIYKIIIEKAWYEN